MNELENIEGLAAKGILERYILQACKYKDHEDKATALCYLVRTINRLIYRDSGGCGCAYTGEDCDHYTGDGLPDPDLYIEATDLLDAVEELAREAHAGQACELSQPRLPGDLPELCLFCECKHPACESCSWQTIVKEEGIY